MALLGMGPRTADVVVLDDCELLRLSRQAFDELLNHDPSSGASLARIMAARLQRALKVRSVVAHMRAVPMITAEECEAVVADRRRRLVESGSEHSRRAGLWATGVELRDAAIVVGASLERHVVMPRRIWRCR